MVTSRNSRRMSGSGRLRGEAGRERGSSRSFSGAESASGRRCRRGWDRDRLVAAHTTSDALSMNLACRDWTHYGPNLDCSKPTIIADYFSDPQALVRTSDPHTAQGLMARRMAAASPRTQPPAFDHAPGRSHHPRRGLREPGRGDTTPVLDAFSSTSWGPSRSSRGQAALSGCALVSPVRGALRDVVQFPGRSG